MGKLADENRVLKGIIEDDRHNEQVMRKGYEEAQKEIARLNRLLAVQERLTNDWRSRFHDEVGRIEELHHEVVANEGVA